MKRLPAIVFILAHALAFGADGEKAPAQAPAVVPDPFAPPGGAPPEEPWIPYNVRIEIQMVSMPERLALPLIADMKKKEKIQAANEKIQEMLANGTAQLQGWPIIMTKSGQRALIEGNQELMYVTRYQPPVVSVREAVDESGANKLPGKVDVTHLEAIPSAFEMRNVGVTFEVEPVVGPDRKTIDLNLVPQHVRLNGFRKLTLLQPATRTSVEVDRPEFDVKKVTTSVTILSGQLMLLGAYPLIDPPKHMELFILKAEVIP